ncbi:(2Fe-2S)-binding protein [Actinomadura kijaniata]|uniref:Ferric siderophore reductase C-terminal domain-containing protein n=1 Tax=Actinomadura namibiensis TaxID=182080 RepID=A0A7W3LI87_ACTNM|nr:(2Fe-2S)-binding protein [Actinomadura namibiensis]MBA8948661.1 hypothetical protein [Actinomadura namibiensis]
MSVPAEAALADVAGLGGFFAVTVGGDGAGWHPVGESYARGLADLVAERHARYGAEERVAASIAQLGHAARLWSPVLACALAHGIVLDLAGLERADDGPRLRLPVARGRPVGERLVEDLYELVVVRHLEALAAGLRVKVASGLLHGNAASALAEAGRALARARPWLRADAARLVGGLLETGRLAGAGRLTGPGLGFRRRSCCLYYRAPGGEKCGDCGLAR